MFRLVCLPARSVRLASIVMMFLATAIFPGRAFGQQTATISIPPNDTYLRLDRQNYSASTTLTAYTWPDRQPANAILLRFNLSGLPAGATVTKAILEMRQTGADGSSSGYKMTAHRIVNVSAQPKFATGFTFDGTTAWTPSNVAYGAPLAQGDIGPAEATALLARKSGRRTWDLTAMIRQWVADPGTNLGVLLNADLTATKDRYRTFASSEHPTQSTRPVLKVTYYAADVQPPSVSVTSPSAGATLSQTVALAATATDDSSVAGVEFRLNGQPIAAEDLSAPYSASWNTATVSDGTYTLTARARDVSGNTAVSSGVAVTIRNGYIVVEPEDTSLQLDASSHSDAGQLTTYTWPDNQPANAILLKFDLSALPAGTVIDRADLHLALIQSDAASAGYRVGAHKIVNRNPRIPLATGISADGVLPWTPSPVRFDGIPLAQADILSAEHEQAIDRASGYKVWTITGMVRDWVADPGQNYGVLLNADATTTKDRYRYFASMENENGSLRPFLRLKVSGGQGGTIAGDTVKPSVSITAPGAGATVSGTATISATASDNVGVTKVTFRVDGASIGEDTSAPYSLSWNTTAVGNGSHSVTAVARDAAGNETTSAAVSVTVSNGSTLPAPTGGGLATQYPGDVGIESHPSVLFVERFDQSSLSAVLGNWSDVRNSSVMSLSTDVPAGSPGGRSLNIPSTAGGSGGHLYRQMPSVNDTLYIRYYIKHPSSGEFMHTGVWAGGSNPPSNWPAPGAGTKPAGNDRFIAAAEHNPTKNKFDHYNYWMDMRLSGDGNYWGNELLNNPNVRAAGDQWTCVEQMVKLNNPVSASNGEHAIWLDGVKVSHLGQGFPNGRWSGGIFTQDPTGSPFEGFRWRSDANLNLNWIWLQNYAPSASGTSNMLFDHLVVATTYIGCLSAAAPSSGGGGDSTLPTVSITAPTGGATVSATTTVSANASDDVGVAGVQFKLDGSNLGAEDTTAPYSVSWNTTNASNGTHTLTAVARDTSGNQRTSGSVNVTVSNASEPVSGGTAVFRSNWSTGTGSSANAITDGNRWPNYWEFNSDDPSRQLLSVVTGGPGGHNALRVLQRGAHAANLQVNNFVGTSNDFYLRFYMRNDDTSGAGDHSVTVDTWKYANLTFVRKFGSSSGWELRMSLYGCGYTYPIGHWGPRSKLANGRWYRFEYHVDFVDSTHIQVHPRIYDDAGNLVLSDVDFSQGDPGSASWNGRSDWTLKSYYAAGHSFCVDPAWVNDFGLGNNGQTGAIDTGLSWYFAAVEIRTDRWPGPVGAPGSAMAAPAPALDQAPSVGEPELLARVGIEESPPNVALARPVAIADRRHSLLLTNDRRIWKAAWRSPVASFW